MFFRKKKQPDTIELGAKRYLKHKEQSLKVLRAINAFEESNNTPEPSEKEVSNPRLTVKAYEILQK